MWYMRQKEEFGDDRSQGIRFYDNTQTCDYLPHWHMSYEVIMVIAEDLTVIVENERYLLHPGDIMVIPSGVVHEIAARADHRSETFEIKALIDNADHILTAGMSGVLQEISKDAGE